MVIYTAAKMPLKLEEVDVDADFKELIACEWESYENPLQSFFRLFCPIRGDGPHAREESLAECTERQLEWHRSDPTSYWQKVVDTTTGKIIAGALWKICPTNPFEHPEQEDATWFPEGGQRDFVNQALERFGAPRATMGQRPQVCKVSPLDLTDVTINQIYFPMQTSISSSPPPATDAREPGILFWIGASKRQRRWVLRCGLMLPSMEFHFIRNMALS